MAHRLMGRAWSRPIALALAAVSLLVIAAPAGAGAIPSSMDALGDSITRGFNACGWYVDCTSHSWAAGDNTSINSHYLRIKAKNSAITGKNYNDAKSGAKMVDLNGQVTTAATRAPQYVTILMGANDVCTSSESTMTSVATFQSQFQSAMSSLNTKLPNAQIFVASIPRIYRLWYIGKDSASARNAWAGFGICQSMLANPTSTAQADVDRRNRVNQRNVDFNSVLANVCATYVNCKFDGNATFNYQFMFSQVSGWDYFHPNDSGQAALAATTYAAGFNW